MWKDLSTGIKIATVPIVLTLGMLLWPLQGEAQSTPELEISASGDITEGETAMFTITASATATEAYIIEVLVDETERPHVIGEVNSNLVPDSNEGIKLAVMLPGQTTTTLTVITTADGLHEDSMAGNGRTNPLVATLQAGNGYTVGTNSSATVNVADDDPDLAIVEFEGGYPTGGAETGPSFREQDGKGTVKLVKSKAISYELAPAVTGTPMSGLSTDDYTISTSTVTIEPAQLEASFEFSIDDDSQIEAPEKLLLTITNNGSQFTQRNLLITVTITDTDTGVVELSSTVAEIEEGDDVTLYLDRVDAGSVCTVSTAQTFTVMASGDTSTLTETQKDVVIPSCQNSVEFTFATIDDTADQRQARTVQFTISGHAGELADRIATRGTASVTVRDEEGKGSALTARPDAILMDLGASSTTLDVLDNDAYPDGNSDELSVESVTSPRHGQAEVLPGGNVGYTPNSGFHGRDIFRYEVTDGIQYSSVYVYVTVPDPDAPRWEVTWEDTSIDEGASTVMLVRQTNPHVTVPNDEQIGVTLHIGRWESTADRDDVVVKNHDGSILRVHPFSPNIHHSGGWVYLIDSTFQEAGRDATTLEAMTIDAISNRDGDETLALWSYVNGYLAGSTTLTITTP